MIFAPIMAAWAWFSGTSAGKYLIAAAVGAAALLGVILWARRTGYQAATAAVVKEDLKAQERANAASVEYRGDGGAAGRLRDGRF